MTSPSVPKAVLYYNPPSVWSAVARLAIEEKGYGVDEIDFRVVDLSKGENYDPTFLRLNPKATVPTLLVPYENSLTEDVESRYKALTDTKSIVEFLDKSRSALSRTHTTSSAPAPSLTPATIEATTICKAIIEILTSATADPRKLRYINARDDASLKSLAQKILPSLKQKEQVLLGHLGHAADGSVRASEKVKGLWTSKLEEVQALVSVLAEADTPLSGLDEKKKAERVEFFQTAQRAWEVNLAEALTQLSKEMVGPYTLGDQFSIADLHLAGWLTRVVKLAGGSGNDDGETVVKKVEEHIGGGFKLARDFKTEQGRREKAEETKIGAFWDGLRERGSWKRIYGAGVF